MKFKNSSKNTFPQERKVNIWHMLLFHTLFIRKGGYWRAEYLRKHGIFHSFGEKCYYHPRKIPTDAYMISIGNNVCIAANVRFVTHDVFSIMFNNCEEYISSNGGNNYGVNYVPINIKDNVCIGEGVHIMPGVTVENDVIIAGGAVVTKNVPSGVIVGGNPAKIIGKTRDLVEKRKQAHKVDWSMTREEIENYYFKYLIINEN